MNAESFVTDLSNALQSVGLAGELSDLQRLTGGANKESWRFKLHSPAGSAAYVLRRDTNAQADLGQALGFGQPNLPAEAAMIKALQNTGIKLPRVIAELPDDSPLGYAFVMSCESGESLPNRILKAPEYAEARMKLANQCGAQLAVLHALDFSDKKLDQLHPDQSTDERIDQLEESSAKLGNDSPVYALAFRWLRENVPTGSRRCVIHGDFRLGNLLVEPEGLSSVLDWELAKFSYPEEDLGYLTANAWRFGQPQNPVGGFGQYDELLNAYEQTAGWRPQMDIIKFWQFFTSVSWGIICLAMRQMYLDGTDRSLERLAIGRRFSAAELDVLMLLDELR